MAQIIRTYIPVNPDMDEDEVVITAFAGGVEDKSNKRTMISIGESKAILSEVQILDMISALSQRLGCLNHHSATSGGACVIMDSDGDYHTR